MKAVISTSYLAQVLVLKSGFGLVADREPLSPDWKNSPNCLCHHTGSAASSFCGKNALIILSTFRIDQQTIGSHFRFLPI